MVNWYLLPKAETLSCLFNRYKQKGAIMKNNIFNKSIFTDGWENRLDEQMLTYNRCKKKAYVCSPLGASTKEQVLQNMREAKVYMYYVSENFGCVARARL